MNKEEREMASEETVKEQRNRPAGRKTPPAFDTIESAAAKLGIDVDALRARCRRAQQRIGDTVPAHLGGGIVAFKFGRSWRVRFPMM
jgi:hypothetical protein